VNRRRFVQLPAAAALLPFAVGSQPRGRRISTNKDHPAYDPYFSYAVVMLDGAQIRRCVFADEQLGEVHCVAGIANGQIEYVARYGRVRIGYLKNHPLHRLGGRQL
jgi:hypothetical protein